MRVLIFAFLLSLNSYSASRPKQMQGMGVIIENQSNKSEFVKIKANDGRIYNIKKTDVLSWSNQKLSVGKSAVFKLPNRVR